MPAVGDSRSKLSIGLLLCDDVPANGRAKFGDYVGMFANGLSKVDRQIKLTPYRAYQGELPAKPATHAGYLISGSAASVFDEHQWIRDLMTFVGAANQHQIRIVGICFGHQLIAHALGGKTVRAEQGWAFGIHSAKLSNLPKWLQTDRDCYRLIVIHQDQVVALPPGFDTIASNDFCPNSMITDGANMLGIQGHPEFSKAYCAWRAAARRELIGEHKYQQTLELLANNSTDSKPVLAWVSQFLRH